MPPSHHVLCPSLLTLTHALLRSTLSKEGMLKRIRREFYASLPIHFRLGSGAGYTFVWLALALIPVIHGTKWWTTTVGYHSVPTLRGTKPGHWLDSKETCNATMLDYPSSPYRSKYSTLLRYYKPNHYSFPIGNMVYDVGPTVHGHVLPTRGHVHPIPTRRLTGKPAPDPHQANQKCKQRTPT